MQKGGGRLEKKETYSEEQKIQIQIKELGTRLKNIREAQGFSITDIADATKIQKHYLYDIEEGNLEHLPKGPYVRSFVRQYCNYLSAPDIWKSYDVITRKQRSALNNVSVGEETNYSDSPKVFKPRSFLYLYLLIALSLGAAGWITWQYRGDITDSATSPIDGGTAGTDIQQREQTSEPVSSDKALSPVSGDAISRDEQVDISWMDGKKQQPGSLKPQGVKDQNVQTAGTSKQDTRPRSVRITAENAYVWAKISQGTKILFEGTMKPGEYKEYEVGLNLPIRVRIGKPNSSSVIWEGKKIFPVADGNRPATKFFWPDGTITDSN